MELEDRGRSLREAKNEGLYYVATPYSKYPRGNVAAFEDAAAAAGALLKRGLAVYSPIAHTHPIATLGQIDPYDHDIWLTLDRHIMDASAACIVVMMPGWRESFGVKHEIEVFESAGKPVHYYSWPELVEVARNG